MKGMVFAGCSHTYGHGLWYYSGLDNIPYGDQNLEIFHNKSSYRNFTEARRFPRLVAQHFDTYEVVKQNTSGTDEVSIEFINFLFDSQASVLWSNQKYEYHEIDYIVFQTTFIDRSNLEVEKNGEKKSIRLGTDINEAGHIVNTVKEYGINSFDEYMSLLQSQMFSKIKKTFQFYESKNIKCRILCWTKDYLDLIKKDEWMFERFIPLQHNGKTYDCALDLVSDGNDHFQILYDHDYFGTNTPKDYHPTLEFHKVIANSIIKKIEK
jgi:hypothetical protein